MSALRNFTFTTFCVLLVVKGLSSAPVNVPLTSVSNLLIQTALNSLNESSPNQHTYQNGELISAQKLEELPFTIYRLTFNLDPACDEISVCPKEACTLEIKQHEQGAVSVNRGSIQCLYLHPQTKPQVPNHDQELIDSLEKQIGDNIKLDHEVQTSADHNDRPFIAVPANKSPYCPGCPYDLNPKNLPGVSAFVDQIIKSMDDSLAGDFKHTAITILRIMRSVPPNANVVRYEFLLLIAETSCLKTSLVERTECSLQPGSQIKRCLVTLEEKPWQENSRVITKNNCTGTNVENELNSSVGPSFSQENTPSGNHSPSSVSHQEGDEDTKTEFYDQVAQEGKFSTYETMPNQYFESPTLNLTVEGDDGNIKRVVVEEPAKKAVVDKDDVPEKKEDSEDRMKEFDSFLKEFDVLVRDVKPIKDDRIPVVEDVIKPVKIESGSQSEEENGKDCSKKRIESFRVKRNLGNDDLVIVEDELLIKKLARKAIAMLDDIDSDTMKRIVLKVLEAKKENEKTNQVNYYLKLKVATTNCNEGELDFAEERRCLEDAIHPVRICKVQLSTSEENPLLSPKVIESACIDFSEEVKTRRRREALVGGPVKKDVNDPKIQKFAQLGLQEYAKNLDSSYEPIIVNITDAKVQVVSGILYKIKVQFGKSTCQKGETENCQLQSDGELKECLIKAWSQPWLDNGNPKVTVDCESDESKGSDNSNSRRLGQNVVRKKRSLPGGITPMDVSDPDIQNYAKLGLKQYSKGLQSSNEPVIAKIVEASSQVVSGMLYRIKVQFGNSDCPKGQTENCQLQSDGERKECLIEAWSQPWLDNGNPKITVDCESDESKGSDNSNSRRLGQNVNVVRKKRSLPGGITPMDVSDPDIQNYAKLGLKQYSRGLQSSNEPLIAKIVEASSQVVSGMLYRIKVQFGDSDCPKGQTEYCQLQSDSELNECEVKAWSRPWLDKGEPEITVTCGSERSKRSTNSKKEEKEFEKEYAQATKDLDLDFEYEPKPIDDQVKADAQTGLKKYAKTCKSPYEPLIAKILHVTTNPDSECDKITVQIGDSTCKKGETKNCKLQTGTELKECVIKMTNVYRNNRIYWELDSVNCNHSKKSPKKSGKKSDKVKTRQRPDTLANKDKEEFEKEFDLPEKIDDQVKKDAQVGLKKYAETSKSPYEPLIAEITHATTNTDSMIDKITVKIGDSTCKKGETQNCKLQTGTTLKECVIKLSTAPYGNEKDLKVTVDCKDSKKSAKKSQDEKSEDEKSEEVKTRQRRDTSLGGPTPMDINNSDIQNYAKLGLKKYSEGLQSSNEPIIVQIVEASSQVVSGMLYRIRVQFGMSNCPKGQTGYCQLQSGSQVTECEVKAWSRPWLDNGNPEITVTCGYGRSKRSTDEEKEAEEFDATYDVQESIDDKVKKDAQVGLKKYAETSKSPYEPLIAKITYSTYNTDSLTRKITVKIGDSNCKKGETQNCKLQTDKKLKECVMKLVRYSDVDVDVTVNCKPSKKSPKKSKKKSKDGKSKDEKSNDEKSEDEKSEEVKTRQRRDTRLGGSTPMDVDNSDIKNYAKLGLKKYSKSLQSPNEPIIVKIVEASSQVVSGTLYTIKVQFGISNCPKGKTENCQLQSDSEVKECEVKAWSKPWVDKGKPEITVTCGSGRTKRSLRGQNYSQKMLQQAEEMKEEENTDQSEKGNLPEENYTEKVQRQAEEIKEERMKDLVPEERSLRGQNYNQKMLKQAEEMKEEQNTDESEKKNLQGVNYSQKMLRQAEEIKEDRMKDLVSEERSLRDQNYNQNMLKQTGEVKDETLEAEQLFRDFVQEFKKVYSNDEEKQKRLGIFRENLKKIKKLRRYEQGTGEYGVTNFTDLTTEEFRSNYLGLRPELKSENEIPFPMAEIPDVSLPTEFDWRKKNAVTGVKDQGSCGSCWAFSVTGNIEGQYAIKHGELLSFSEQELVDCDKLDEGCNGGLPDSAYRAIEKLGGLETESDYPYDAEDETCHLSKSKIKVKVVSAVNITSNETGMAQWLVQNGPISIGINANAMQFYIGGISHPPKFLCNPKNLDHGVLVVGFGVHTYPIFKKTLPFWIVKNSWGPRWGERGYYRVYRGGSTCGVNQMASSAIVA